MEKTALGIIDAQRGFMPAIEGERLNTEGFGELPIQDGEHIVPYVNALLGEAALLGLPIFTTQDWHPQDTAHFAVEPNYNTTWPPHCVSNTAGAELHPAIVLPGTTEQFYKGAEVLQRGEDDTSYSGYNALRFTDDLDLPAWLKQHNIEHVVLGGLALDYCVRATALDLRQKASLRVTIIADAVEAVAQETGLAAIDELEAAGIEFVATDEWVRSVQKAA